jgi:hypothetical protein
MFAIGQRVELVLGATNVVPGNVIKVGYNATHQWYSVRLDDKIELHGIEDINLRASGAPAGDPGVPT